MTIITAIILCVISSIVHADAIDNEVAAAFSGLTQKERADSLNNAGNRLAGADTTRALAYMRAAFDLSDSIAYPVGKAMALSNTGQIYYTAAAYSLAADYFKRALEAIDGDETHTMTGYLYRRYGNALHRAGDNDGARNAFHNSLRILSARGDSLGISYITNNMGLFYIRTTEYDSALVYYPIAREYYRGLGNMTAEAAMINSIGTAYYQLGFYELALKQYLESLEIRKKTDDKPGISRVLNNIGKTLHDLGNNTDARKYYLEALDVSRRAEHPGVIGYSLFNLGELEEAEGNLDSALQYYMESETFRREENDVPSLAQTLNAIGAITSKTGRYEKAMSVLEDAYSMTAAIENREGMAVALKNMGAAHAAAGYTEKAIECFEMSMKITAGTGNRELHGETLKLAADLYESTGDYGDALMYWKQYMALQDSLFGEETAKNIDHLRIVYETEQKERENEILRQRQSDQDKLIERNRTIILLVSLCLALAALFAVVIYVLYAAKHKANEELAETNCKIMEQHDEIEQKNADLEKALSHIKFLSGLLPICANCKKIRSDDGYWEEVEGYISKHSDAMFSHGICPDCINKLYPGLLDKTKRNNLQ